MVIYIRLGMRAKEYKIDSHNWKGITQSIIKYHRVSQSIKGFEMVIFYIL